MDRLQEEKNTIIHMTVAFLKIFIFYSLVIAFSYKTYSIEYINSISEFFKIVFFSKYTLKVVVLSLASCMVCIVTILPSAFLLFSIQKYIKKEISFVVAMYTAVIVSCFVLSFSCKFITHVELYLCYLVFLPFEKIVRRNKSTVIIWSIAAVMSAFVFHHLDNNDVNKMQCSVAISKVYVCTSKGAKVYHRYRDCKGLNRCGRQIKAVSLEQAKRMGRRCKMCY